MPDKAVLHALSLTLSGPRATVKQTLSLPSMWGLHLWHHSKCADRTVRDCGGAGMVRRSRRERSHRQLARQEFRELQPLQSSLVHIGTSTDEVVPEPVSGCAQGGRKPYWRCICAQRQVEVAEGGNLDQPGFDGVDCRGEDGVRAGAGERPPAP